MTDPAADLVEAQTRSLRRIGILALVVVALAAAGAVAVIVTQRSPRPDAAALLPARFGEQGFVDASVRRVSAWGYGRDAQRQTQLVTLPPHVPVWVIARCDSGRVTVALGTLSSSAQCTGRPVGVVGLTPSGTRLRLRVTVDRPQRGPWAIGVYR